MRGDHIYKHESVYMHISMYIHTYLFVYLSIYLSIYLSFIFYTYIYIWQRIKNIGLVTGLGGHFATKACNRPERSATNPSATSSFKTTVLSTHRSATRVCNKRPATKVCNRRGGPATTRVLIHSHIFTYHPSENTSTSPSRPKHVTYEYLHPL